MYTVAYCNALPKYNYNYVVITLIVGLAPQVFVLGPRKEL
jgi:hypothetical protein